MTEKKFNPNDHLVSIQGKDYLPVAYRLVWFREEHADWGIRTELAKLFENGAIFKAQILDEKGNIIAEAHKMETKAGFGDYLEKAETGSIGRALAMCGYGTQFSPDLEEGTQRVVDAPIIDSKASFEPSRPIATGGITMPQQGMIRKMYLEKKLDSDAMKLVLKKMYGIDSHKALSKEQASDYIKYLLDIESPKEETLDSLSDLDGNLGDESL